MRHSRLGILIAGAVLALGIISAPAARCDEEKPKEAPKAVYMNYHDVLLKAATVDEIKPFVSKDFVAKIDATPKEEQDSLFQGLKATTPLKIYVGSQSIENGKADLWLTGVTPAPAQAPPKEKDAAKDKDDADDDAKDSDSKDVTMTGEIQFVNENNAWKIDSEKWTANSEDSK